MRKLTRKLLLSMFTLAVCAVTLVSTTFAWYTTNTEVNASQITGKASSDGDASILISKNGTDYAQSVSLSDKLDNATSLVPVQVLSDGSFKFLEGDGDASGAVLHFKLWFKTAVEGQEAPIYIGNMTIKNQETSLADLTPFDNLLYTGTAGTNGGLDTAKSKYYVDVVDTLAMKTLPQTGTTNYFDLQDIVTSLVKNNTNPELITPTTPNAEEYYEKVNDNTSITETGTATLKPLALGTGARTEIVKATYEGVYVDFYIFINGWDEYCYDACKGQAFDINIQFTVTA